MKRLMIIVAALGCALPAFADKFTWYNFATDASVTNQASWRVNSAIPAKSPGYDCNDEFEFSNFPTTPATVFFPSVDFYAKNMVLYWRDGGERTLVLRGVDEDGSPSVFTMASSHEQPRTAGNVISLSSGGGSYYFQHSVAAAAVEEPAFVWSNANVRMAKTDKRNVRMEFLGGEYDFSDSFAANTTSLTQSSSGDQHESCAVSFQNAVARFSNFYDYCRASDGSLTFDGGSYVFEGYLKVVPDSLSPAGTTSVRIVSNAVVKVAGQLWTGAAAGHPSLLTVADGGVLESTYAANYCSLGGGSESAVVIGTDGTYCLTSGNSTRISTRLVVTGENAKVVASLPDGGKGELLAGVSGGGSIFVADGGTLGAPGRKLKITLGHSTGTNMLHIADGGAVYCSNGLTTGCDYNNVTLSNVVCVTGGTGQFSEILLRPDSYGSNNSGDSFNVYHQTGGAVTVDGNFLCVGKNLDRKYGHVVLDGGTLTCAKLYSTASQKAGKSAHAAFSANGGTLAPNRSTDSFFSAFDSAKLGTDGLTLALGDFDVTLGQRFVNEDGVDGTLAKTGSGTLTLNGEAAASTFSVLELKEGVAAFAAGVSAFAPTIAVDAQAQLDVSNLGDALDFGGLTLGSAQGMGFLKCKTTQTIALSTVSVVRAGLILSDVHTAGTYPLLRAPTASVDAATVDAWWTSSVMGGRQDGLCYTFTTAVDGDYTVFALVVATGTEPANVVTWRGSGENATWADPANWQGTRQGAADVATFTGGAGDAKRVLLDGDAVVGKLDYVGTDADYLLTGSGRLTFADTGYASISVAGGEQTIENELTLNGMLSAYVAGGAKLVLDGAISGGGLAKTGAGELELGSENAFTMGIEARGGFLTARTPGALDSVSPDRQTVTIGDGTLRIAGDPTDEETRLDRDVVLETSAASKAAVIDTDANVTFGTLSSTAGALIKKGRGRLTFEIGGEAKTASSSGNLVSAGTPVNFSADGTPPTEGFGGLTVAEGEVVLRGTLSTAPSDASQAFSMADALKLGTATTNVLSASPRLTVDHAYVYFGATTSYVAPYMAAAQGCPSMQTVDFVLTNGANVAAKTYFYVGNAASSDNGMSATANVRLYDSSFSGPWDLYMPGRSNCRVNFDARNSNLAVRGGISVYGPLSGVMSGGTISQYRDARKVGSLTLNGYADGSILFTDGAVVHAAAMKCTQDVQGDRRFQFVFDNAELDLARADPGHKEDGVNSDFSTTNICQRGDQFDVVAQGDLRLYAGKSSKSLVQQTLTWYQPVIGTGGIVKIGEGILDVKPAAILNGSNVQTALANPVTLRTTGTNRVEAGVMKVSDGAGDGALIEVCADAELVLAGNNSVRVSGGGTVSGGTISGGTISVAYDPVARQVVGDVPTVASAFSGRTLVDLGLPSDFVFERPFPKGLRVMKYEGTAPLNLSTFRLANAKTLKVRAAFSLVDGYVVMDVEQGKGMMLVVR